MKVVTASMTLPSMMPIKGTMSAFLNRILCNKTMKQSVPASGATKATPALIHVAYPAVRSIASTTPKRHQASVPAVEGETNLLLVSVCMIRPEIDRPVPAMTMASVRGSLLTRPMKRSAGSPVRKPDRLKSSTPIAIEHSDESATASKSTLRTTPGVFHFNIANRFLAAGADMNGLF